MTDKNMKRIPRSYSDEFKRQLIAPYHNGKRMKCGGKRLDVCKSRNEWHCICVLVNLFNREIIGCSAEKSKTLDEVL